jgi:hypothetical protein
LCERATNLARADQRNLIARHLKNIPNLYPLPSLGARASRPHS